MTGTSYSNCGDGYDQNGNVGFGGCRNYSWNYDNQPTTIQIPGATENYKYDADGERVSRYNSSTGLTTYFIGGGLWEQDTAGTTNVMYQFGGAVTAQRSYPASGGNTLIYLHGDHLGSASVVTSASGAVVSQQDFDPWGNLRTNLYSGSTITQTDVNYTGQVKDGTGGLLYYHARYYDPFVSRFVSADTEAPDTNDPQSLNRYSYVLNNPLYYTDPTGHRQINDGGTNNPRNKPPEGGKGGHSGPKTPSNTAQIPYYSQFDKRWASDQLPLQPDPDGPNYTTVAAQGCVFISHKMLADGGFVQHKKFGDVVDNSQNSIESALKSRSANIDEIAKSVGQGLAVLITVDFFGGKYTATEPLLDKSGNAVATLNLTWVSHTFVAIGVTANGEIIILDPAGHGEFTLLRKYLDPQGLKTVIASATSYQKR